ncbi:MAG TPA: hypothetical protein VNW06_06840, partial [Cytophagaceae bacterium]|nr:hypothetical protein [Cytophagaceae bacterium]
MENRKIYISQKDNFAGAFGLVYRSSAIFYFKQTNNFNTTISFMNYWSVKRSLDIMIVASIRKMDGTLMKREELFFKNGAVINYSPMKNDNFFEGSVEIEIFSSKNMVIPYSAIMVIYESLNSISMTHSYGRTYSPHEVEEGRTITIGEEGCWTIRDNDEISSFAIMHNGSDIQEEQSASLEIINYKNEKHVVKFNIPQLSPFASFKIIPGNYFSTLKDFLEGKPGNASLSFNLNKSFTRMLIGNETMDGSEFQITHSNFNYSKHETDNAGEGFAYMLIPQSKFKDLKIVVYPETTKGNYKVETEDGRVHKFKSGERLELNAIPGMLKFSKLDGNLPSRIVTALTAKAERSDSLLPFECSLGVIHKLRPLK